MFIAQIPGPFLRILEARLQVILNILFVLQAVPVQRLAIAGVVSGCLGTFVLVVASLLFEWLSGRNSGGHLTNRKTSFAIAMVISLYLWFWICTGAELSATFSLFRLLWKGLLTGLLIYLGSHICTEVGEQIMPDLDVDDGDSDVD